jgi:nucleoside-diphosphate kinase
MERTLIIFKPDAMMRGIVGEILTRFERVGLKIVGAKMVQPDEGHYHHHYETIGTVITRNGQVIFDNNLKYMLEGPVIAMVLEGVEAVSLVRKMVGPTEPKSAQPGTIRGDYAHMSYGHADGSGISIPNIIHASGNLDEALLEVPHWFSDSELFEYETVAQQFTQRSSQKPKKK